MTDVWQEYDCHIDLENTVATLHKYGLRQNLDLVFQDANGKTHSEPLARYDGKPYRLMALRNNNTRALIRLSDGREAEMPAYAL